MTTTTENGLPGAPPVRTVRRGGRPGGATRVLKVEVRVSADEKAGLQGSAAEAGLSVSEYVRRRSLGHPVTARADRETRVLLRRIGVNLNQLARAANAAASNAAASNAVDGRPAGGPEDNSFKTRVACSLEELRVALAAVGDGPPAGPALP